MVMKELVRCIIKCVNNFNTCNCDGWTIFDKKKAVIYHSCITFPEKNYITTTFALHSGKIKVNDAIFKNPNRCKIFYAKLYQNIILSSNYFIFLKC